MNTYNKNDGKDLKLGKDEMHAIDAIKSGIEVPKYLYNDIYDENFKLFLFESLTNEIYKIVKNTLKTIAISTMGNIAYLVYNVKKKSFEWRFTKGTLDTTAKSSTKNYYVVRLPMRKSLVKVDRLSLETFAGKSSIMINPCDIYHHVDYKHNYIKGDDGEVYAEDNTSVGLGFRCCHLNSIYEDNNLSNLMWLSNSEERILHYINGNVHFGDPNMETIIYRKKDNLPICSQPSIRKAGEYLGLTGNGGTVVKDNKGKLDIGEEIVVDNEVYYCEYYLNLDIAEQMRVDRILKRSKLIYDSPSYKNINYNVDKRTRKAKERLIKKKNEFDKFAPYIYNRWKSLTGIQCELNFKTCIIP